MSERHSVTLRMEPIPSEVQAVYRRRGLVPPEASSPYDPAALWPVHPRLRHRTHAALRGFFWLPCVLCGQGFAGHEIVDSIPDPTAEHIWMSICPFCTAERNGGQP